MSLNERIKKVRKFFELTQAEFGRKIGIVQGHLTGLESGKKSVTPKTIKVICTSYGISEEWLRTGNGEMLAQNPNERANRVIHLFKELNSEFQDYMLIQLKNLLTLQNISQKNEQFIEFKETFKQLNDNDQKDVLTLLNKIQKKSKRKLSNQLVVTA